MIARRKTVLVLAGTALLFAAPAAAGDRVQFKGSTSIELPTPKRSLDESRTLRLPEGPNGRGEYESSSATAAGLGVAPAAPLIDKKLKEFLDKKQNWIFVNPYEEQFDSKTEEFMDPEKASGLLDHHLLEDEEKSVLEKYLDEKNPSREEDPDSSTRDRDPERSSRGPDVETPGTQDRPEVVMNDLLNQKAAEKASALSIEPKTPSLFGQTSIFEQKADRGIFGERPLSGGLDSGISKEDLRKERDLRDAEITRMLQPRSGPAAAGSRLDLVNSGVDATRQEANPIGARRTDSFLNSPGRSQPAVGGISGARTAPIFSGGSSPSSLPARSGFDFGARGSTPGPGSFSAGSIAPPVIAPRPAVNNKPFVLPLPQRKF